MTRLAEPVATAPMPMPAPARSRTRTPDRRRPHRSSRLNPAYLFVAPALVLAAAFILWPILQSGWMSLHDWTIGESSHKWLGLGNYSELWHDSRFWNAAHTTKGIST